MELFAIGICALCAVLFAALVQKTNKEYALLISLGTAAVLLLFLLERAGPVLQQVVARLCKDAGESALAYTVELAARAAVLAAALPALGRLLKYLGEIAAL